jgi:hypothetical protein
MELIWKSHQSFSYRGEMKERLKSLSGDVTTDLDYALFPNKISYRRHSDGKIISTNDIVLQVTKQNDIMRSILHQKIAERWAKLGVRDGGSLFRKFGKECGLADACGNASHHRATKSVPANTKERIITNLYDMD